MEKIAELRRKRRRLAELNRLLCELRQMRARLLRRELLEECHGDNAARLKRCGLVEGLHRLISEPRDEPIRSVLLCGGLDASMREDLARCGELELSFDGLSLPLPLGILTVIAYRNAMPA